MINTHANTRLFINERTIFLVVEMHVEGADLEIQLA